MRYLPFGKKFYNFFDVTVGYFYLMFVNHVISLWLPFLNFPIGFCNFMHFGFFNPMFLNFLRHFMIVFYDFMINFCDFCHFLILSQCACN